MAEITVVENVADAPGDDPAEIEAELEAPAAEAIAEATVEIAEIEADRDVEITELQTEAALEQTRAHLEAQENAELEACRTQITALQAEVAQLETELSTRPLLTELPPPSLPGEPASVEPTLASQIPTEVESPPEPEPKKRRGVKFI